MTRVLVKGYNLGRAKGAGAQSLTYRTMVRAKHAGPTRGHQQIVLQQELDDDDTTDEWAMHRHLFPTNRYDTWPGPDTAGQHVAITLPHGLANRGEKVTKVSDGMRKVSPDRYVVRRIAVFPGRRPVAFLSTQFVAGAFTTPGQAAEAYRSDAWAEGFAGFKDVAAECVDRDITVVYECDGNNPHMPKVHPREVRLLDNGLDHMGIIPGRTKVRAVDTGITDLTLDGHNLLWALLEV